VFSLDVDVLIHEDINKELLFTRLCLIICMSNTVSCLVPIFGDLPLYFFISKRMVVRMFASYSQLLLMIFFLGFRYGNTLSDWYG